MTSITMDASKGNSVAQSARIGVYTTSFGLSLGLTNLFNALLVIVKETNEDTVLAWMKAIGHHWAVHGILDVAVFVALGFLLAHVGETWRSHAGRVTAIAVGGVIVGALSIAGFYIRSAF